ncbi:hypothetical protein BY996DRAFT_6514662 [Phakopsora pachyrhizi]|nr:hypothetical protein BY996DRAFT_6514662 [Phakopsora pachyrhizi]
MRTKRTQKGNFKKTKKKIHWLALESEELKEKAEPVGRHGWHFWKEEQKLDGGAHQGQSAWRKTTGATDL